MSTNQEENQTKKNKGGNPAWVKGVSPWPAGRPKRSPLEKPLTNREVRSAELLNLVRKFKPLQAKAIQTAAKMLDNENAAENSKLKAAALIIQTYRQLLLDTFDYRYDDAETEEVNQNQPIFSLKMIGEDKKIA